MKYYVIFNGMIAQSVASLAEANNVVKQSKTNDNAFFGATAEVAQVLDNPEIVEANLTP